MLLAAHPAGLSADQLEPLLHETPTARTTVRAELSRLRRLLPPLLDSRPYRLQGPVTADWQSATTLAAAGLASHAVGLYRGPLLPASDAPGIQRLRAETHHTVRRAALASGDPDTMLRLADTDHGRDDWELWTTVLACLPPGSPRRAHVLTHLEALDQLLH